jgi:hypothetical protein
MLNLELELSEDRELEKFNNEFKNLRKDGKSKGKIFEDSFFDKKIKF